MTSSRLADTFERLRAAGRMAFIPYLTAGYPDAAGSVELGILLAQHGADMIEIGIPFSDPLGDGPTIQRASTAALAQGMTVSGALAVARTVASSQTSGVSGSAVPLSTDHRQLTTPLLAMSYANPLLRYGLHRFAREAAGAGICGLIVPDLPVEESDEWRSCCRTHGIDLIYLLAPTSSEARIAAVAARAGGFIYCMALAGVTGARADLSAELPNFLARVRRHTTLPLVVGFGISQPEHIAQLHGLADGAVVASALIDLIDASAGSGQTPVAGSQGYEAPTNYLQLVTDYVERMSAACSAS